MTLLLTKAAEYLWSRWRTVIIAVGVVAALWIAHGFIVRAAYNRAFNAGWAALAAKDEAEASKARKVNDTAVAKADTERVADTAAINTDKEARDAAINKAPVSTTGAATRAANCVRWTQQHPTSKTQPAGCRSGH